MSKIITAVLFATSLLTLAVLSLNVHAHSDKSESITSPTPKQLAQQQLDAYNNRDIEAFLIPYAEDVEIYNFPNQLAYKGKAQMRKTYTKMFAKYVDLHCKLVNRIVFGDTIIDQEYVTGFDKGEVVEATAIYKIKDGKIAKVYFMSKN